MSQRYSTEQWREWIEEQAESGLSIAAFCDSIGVAANAFYYRRRRLRENRRDSDVAGHSSATHEINGAGFVGIRLAAELRHSDNVSLKTYQKTIEADFGDALRGPILSPRLSP